MDLLLLVVLGAMATTLENCKRQKHDRQIIARLIFQSDPVFNAAVYGKGAIRIIEGMLQLAGNYFDSRHTRCAVQEGRVVGLVVGFPLSEKRAIDQKSGKDFARTMGFFRFLSRLPLFVRMEAMMPAVEDEDGYYIHTICVDAAFRGQGLGTEMIEQVASEHGSLYLHVNRSNGAAIRFYQRNGFKRLAEGSMMYRGHELTQVLMGRNGAADLKDCRDGDGGEAT